MVGVEWMRVIFRGWVGRGRLFVVLERGAGDGGEMVAEKPRAKFTKLLFGPPLALIWAGVISAFGSHSGFITTQQKMSNQLTLFIIC